MSRVPSGTLRLNKSHEVWSRTVSEQVEDAPIDRGGYDFNAMQAKWRPVWEKLDPFKAKDGGSAERRYPLTMFSYPSGDLHMGHAEVFALHDVLARYWFQQGYDVLNPIGWDSFGLPAENAAIKRNEHPATYTYANIETQAESIRRYALSFDWSRRLHTSDPEYYRWTQWLFLRFFERGLAYRKASFVNWCPFDQTVLANEQVIQGRCERCGHEVTKRELTQWYFKTTEYAQRLLDDMELLQWPEEILLMQRNWIGRSEGAFANFQVEGREEPIKVFTTRPDTLFGATFMVVAPDAKLAAELVTPDQQAAFDEYLAAVKSTTEIERLSTEREKTGVFLGSYAINPVTGQRIPIWAADYVLADYGTGAIMAVPGQDTRDWEFAEKFGLPIVRTVQPPEDFDGKAYTGDGPAINSSNDEISLDGLDVAEAKARTIDWLEAKGLGERTINYRLRDWLLSRQRFGGAPIPIIHCPSCGEVPVPDDQLPMELPDLRGADLQPKGVSPLAADREWVEVDCPKCGGKAERDTDTMDTFVDSSWYFLRYLSPEYVEGPFDPAAAERWMSVYQYVGGKEHAVLHLLYARFFVKALHDMGMLSVVEPFTRLLNQGQVINQGKAMSKSLGNGVNLGDQIDAYGVDAIRLTMVFAGPPSDDIDWADMSPSGSVKWLARVARVAADVAALPTADARDEVIDRAVAHTVDDVTRLLQAHRLNVAIARLMELTNALRKGIDGASPPPTSLRDGVTALATMLSCFAPYTAEEVWSRLGHDVEAGDSVHASTWPTADPALLIEDTVTCVVQVSGKVRDRLEVAPSIGEGELRELALSSGAVVRALN